MKTKSKKKSLKEKISNRKIITKLLEQIAKETNQEKKDKLIIQLNIHKNKKK
jgi:hypothetical protein